MKIQVKHKCKDYKTFRAQKVKSLFNPERGDRFEHVAELPVESGDWQIGLIVGPSGSGKTSLGRKVWNDINIHDLYRGWPTDQPIIDAILPDGKLDDVTGALAAVGLGDVPSWFKPFKSLSNGQKYRAGLARLMASDEDRVVIDEFTSVVDRQIAKIGAGAFSKSWRRKKGAQAILLSCHYDVIEWLQPDWVYDTATGAVKKKSKNDPRSYLKFSRQTEVTGNFLSHIII